MLRKGVLPRQRARRAGATTTLALVSALLCTTTASSPSPASADDGIIIIVPGCVVDPSDVIGWWPGQNDLLAAIGPDLSGDVGFGAALFGTGFSFGGTETLVAPQLPVVSSGLTVEMWVKPSVGTFTGANQVLASRWDFPSEDDSARSFLLLIDPYGDLMWLTDETSTRRPEELRAAVAAMRDGAFHHVAATWDPLLMALYVDGYVVASRPSQGGTLNGAATTPFRLASQGGLGGASHFSGIIDEPSIIKRALTPAEIEQMVGAGPNSKCVVAPTP